MRGYWFLALLLLLLGLLIASPLILGPLEQLGIQMRPLCLACTSRSAPTNTPAPIVLTIETRLPFSPVATRTSAPTELATVGGATASAAATATRFPTATLRPVDPLPSPLPPVTLASLPVGTTIPTRALPTLTLLAQYDAPMLLEPPDGSTIGRTTLLRWSSSHQPAPGESYDILVQPEGAAEPTSIGTTSDAGYSLDTRTWRFGPTNGRYFWTVRLARVGGPYLSPPSGSRSFIVGDFAPVLPPPTATPAPPTPTRRPTRTPTP